MRQNAADGQLESLRPVHRAAAAANAPRRQAPHRPARGRRGRSTRAADPAGARDPERGAGGGRIACPLRRARVTAQAIRVFRPSDLATAIRASGQAIRAPASTSPGAAQPVRVSKPGDSRPGAGRLVRRNRRFASRAQRFGAGDSRRDAGDSPPKPGDSRPEGGDSAHPGADSSPDSKFFRSKISFKIRLFTKSSKFFSAMRQKTLEMPHCGII